MIVLVFLFLLQLTSGGKILVLLPIGGKSIEHAFLPVVEQLVRKNHNVTIVWPDKYPIDEERSNLRVITIEQTPQKETQIITSVFQTPVKHGVLFFKDFRDAFLPPCQSFLKNKRVKKLISNGQDFDLVIVSGFMNECPLLIANLVGAKTVLLSPNTIFPWTPVDDIRTPSYVPNMMATLTDRMSFWQRISNTFHYIAIRFIHDYQLIPAVEELVSKHVPQARSFNQALDNVSLIFTNTDPIIITPRPSMPNVISIGGIHCNKKTQPLPTQFEQFIGKWKQNGFILFSLGSNAQSKYLPASVKNHLLKAFSKLQLGVIWKYEEQLDDVPNNVMLTKWTPQQDLLAHSKIRLFITHGGLLSLHQAVYHGVALIGIPLFADQPGNIARIEQLNIGLGLQFNNITSDNLLFLINTIINDKKYEQNVKKYSAVFRDHVDNSIDKVMYWIEYLLVHRDVNHFKSQVRHINWFSYFLLDFFIVFSLLLYLTIVSINILYKKSFAN